MNLRLKIHTLIVGTMMLSVVISSQTSRADDAESLYQKGVDAFKQGKYIEASQAFREANKAKPSWKLQYNIGQCEAAAKRHGLALSAFEIYLSRGGDDIPPNRRDEVLAEVERLRKMVGRVSVVAPDGVAVYIDGVDQGTAPLLGKIPVAASVDHEIWAIQDGKELKRQRFRVSGGDTINIEISVPIKADSASAAPDTPAAPRPSDSSPPAHTGPEELGTAGSAMDSASVKTGSKPTKTLSLAGWVLTGSGAALIVAGAITGGLALGKDNDLNNQCEESHCPSSADGDIESMNNLAVVTNVLLGVGAAAAVTGAVLLIVGAKKERTQEKELAVVPVLSPNYGGLAIEGRF